MIQNSKHPWGAFLYARARAIEWMASAEGMGYSDEQIAQALSMDTMQVTLIRMTPLDAALQAPAVEGWQPEVEKRVREYLWLSHGHPGVYGDDGEMQCGECAAFGHYDYKRAPLSKLLDVLERVGIARVKAALEHLPPCPRKERSHEP